MYGEVRWELHLLPRHPLLRLRLVLLPPPRKRRPLVDDVPDGPEHALFVGFGADVVVLVSLSKCLQSMRLKVVG